MKYIFVLLFLLSIKVSAQTVVNYQTWTGASGCNIFASATNVPATPSAVTHLSTVGQPTYDGVNKAVSLDCSNNPLANFFGTEYRIAYNFKQSYSYSIKINAISIVTSGNFPNLRLRLTSSTGTSTLCTGPKTIDQSTFDAFTQTQEVTNTLFYDLTYNFNSIGSAKPYLTIAALPKAGDFNKTILIRKITITETAPAPSFTLSPATVAKTCGTALSQTFTVTNVNNTPGVTSYVWNLGTSNGWKYNNAAAPSSITTTTNTLTLTADACTNGLSNVAASAVIGSTNYAAGTASTSVSLPNLSISGANIFCGASSTYSIANLPCNATVSWTSSNTSVATVSPTGSQVTVTRSNAGNTTLTATISGCSVSRVVTKSIRLGGYSSSDYPIFPTDPVSANCGQWVYFNTNQLPDATSYTWMYPQTWTANGYTTYSLGLQIPSNVQSGNYQVGVRVANVCDAGGSYSVKNFYVNCTGYVAPYDISPNPATNEVTIAVSQATAKASKTTSITEINIYDQQGGLKKTQRFNKMKQVKMNISALSTGVYFIEIIDDDKRSRQQLSVLK